MSAPGLCVLFSSRTPWNISRTPWGARAPFWRPLHCSTVTQVFNSNTYDALEKEYSKVIITLKAYWVFKLIFVLKVIAGPSGLAV
jgi:hypothetical protein